MLLALLIPGVPVAAANVSGVWNVAFKASWTIRDLVCTFKQDDQKLTGDCSDKRGNSVALMAGEVKGNQAGWQWNIVCTSDGQTCSYAFTGSLDETGMAMQGTFSVNSQYGGRFTAKKQ